MENLDYSQENFPASTGDVGLENPDVNSSVSRHLTGQFYTPTDSTTNSTAFIEQLQRKVEILDQKLYDIQNLTLLKEEELNELRISHNRRLERFQALQENYKKLKDQLDDIGKPTLEWNYDNSLQQNDYRPKPEDLQQEDTDAVWNELAYFKVQNKNLMWERLEMQEALDKMQVKHSHDAASLLEMKIALQHEREDNEQLQLKYDGQKTELQTELKGLRSERIANQAKLEKLEKELKTFHNVKNWFLDDRRFLKSEISNLHETINQHHIDSAKLRRQLFLLKGKLQQETRQVQKLELQVKVAEKIPTTLIQKQLQDSDISLAKIGNFKEDDKEQVSKNTQSDLCQISPKVADKYLALQTSLSQPCLSPAPSQTSSANISNSAVNSFKSSSSCNSKKVAVPSSKKFSKISRSCHLKTKSDNYNRKRSPIVKFKRSYSAPPEVRNKSNRPINIPKGKKKNRCSPPVLFKPKKEKKIFKQGNNSRYWQNHELRKQVCSLKNYRDIAEKSNKKLKESVQQLQSDLISANKKMKVFRQRSRKIHGLYEKSLAEKSDLEKELKDNDDSKYYIEELQENVTILQDCKRDLENKLKKIQRLYEKSMTEKSVLENEIKDKEDNKQCIAELQENVSTLQDSKKELENKVKSYSKEINRVSALNKNMKTDRKNYQNHIMFLTSRMNWLERDIFQKRHLIEGQRVKMKEMQDNVKSMSESINILESNLKQENEICEQQKLKNHQYQYRIQNHKKRQTAFAELEESAMKRIADITAQSEAAITNIEDELIAANLKLEQFHRFVKNMSHELVLHTDQVRELMNKSQTKNNLEQLPSYGNLEKAKNLAKNILNIDDEDLNDIMKGNCFTTKSLNEIDEHYIRDHKWESLCEETIKSSEDFVLPLIHLFKEKIQEKDNLLQNLYSTSH